MKAFLDYICEKGQLQSYFKESTLEINIYDNGYVVIYRKLPNDMYYWIMEKDKGKEFKKMRSVYSMLDFFCIYSPFTFFSRWWRFI